MKAHTTLTISFKVTTPSRRFRIFPYLKKEYVTATFEGEMEVGDLRVGEQLSLLIFNEIPVKFRMRDITKTPDPKGGEVKNSIELYIPSISAEMTEEGIRRHSVEEICRRLQTTIAARLSRYGLELTGAVDCSPKPKIEFISSSLCIPDYMIPSYA